MTSTVCAPPGARPAVPDSHPGVDPADVAAAALAVAQLGAIPIVTVAPTELGPCIACPPGGALPPDPAGAVLAHRENDDEQSFRYRWPLCPRHLLVEARGLAARAVPTWVEVPTAVLP